MNHRHLLPNEIDLLLDGEGGFGMAPLRAHLLECADCQGRLEEARLVAEMLEELPHFAPSASMAERIMAEVPVFVPWHVAARDAVSEAVTRWAPASRPLRVAAALAVASVTSVLTLAILWIATQTDLLVVGTSIAGSRVRGIAGEALQQIAVSLLGEQAFAALQHAGPLALSLIAAGMVVVGAGAVLGLRRLTLASTPAGH